MRYLSLARSAACIIALCAPRSKRVVFFIRSVVHYPNSILSPSFLVGLFFYARQYHLTNNARRVVRPRLPRRASWGQRPPLLINRLDADRLQRLIDNATDKDQMVAELLQDELSRGEVVDPEDIPDNVVSMNSQIQFTDLTRNQQMVRTLVYPHSLSTTKDAISIMAPHWSQPIRAQSGRHHRLAAAQSAKCSPASRRDSLATRTREAVPPLTSIKRATYANRKVASARTLEMNGMGE